MNRLLILLLLLPCLASCAANRQASTPVVAGSGAPALFEITSPAFTAGEAIPSVYSCQGEDHSPALEWSDPPPGTQSLALVMDDPDAPGKTWVHWIVFNLPPDSRGLAESASTARGTSSLPEGARSGKNSSGREDYGGPCPPSGTHRYFFHLYALDTTLDDQPLDKTALLKAIEGHVLDQGELMGTYAK